MLCKMKRCGKEIPDDAIFCPYCGKAQKKDPKKPASRADGLMERKLTIDGVRISFYGKTEREIQNKILEYRAQKERQKAKAQLFESVADEWSEKHFATLSPTSLRGYKRPLERAIEHFGAEDIFQITPRDCQAFVGKLCRQGYARKTISTHVQILKMVFDFAIIYGYMDVNPMAAVKLPKDLPQRVRQPADEATLKIINSSWQEPFGLLPFLCRYTGLRRGEALALQGKHFDFENKLIFVEQTVYWEGNKPRLKAPKTKAGVRPVPLVDVLGEKIRALDLAPEQFLFSGPGGGLLTFSQQQDQWEKYLLSVGLATYDPARRLCHPNLELHQLRHNYASDLYDLRIGEKEMEEIMGHTDAQFSRSQYVAVRGQALQQAAEQINRLFAAQA